MSMVCMILNMLTTICSAITTLLQIYEWFAILYLIKVETKLEVESIIHLNRETGFNRTEVIQKYVFFGFVFVTQMIFIIYKSWAIFDYTKANLLVPDFVKISFTTQLSS